MTKKELVEKLLDILEFDDIDVVKLAIEKLIKDLNSGISAPGRSQELETKELTQKEENDEFEKILKIDSFIFLNIFKYLHLQNFNQKLNSQSQKNEINRKRITNFYSCFNKIKFIKELKLFAINKSDNPDWKEKLENFIKTDNKLCADLSLDGPTY